MRGSQDRPLPETGVVWLGVAAWIRAPVVLMVMSTELRRLSMVGVVGERQRRPHGQLREAMRDFLAGRTSPASIKEIAEGVESRVGVAPASSYRSALQDERYFQRVSRGVFQLTGDEVPQ